MPTAFLTEEQHAAYGDYTGDPDPTQLAKFFHLDEVDLQRVRRHNGSHHRLGFALQLGTVRFLGTFLANPIAVPPIVIDFMARQLAIATTYTLDRYLEREDTKWEHAREICQDYGYHDFHDQPWHFRLIRWLYARAWFSNERPFVLFEHAMAWLMHHKVLLPGPTTLERLIGTIQERSTTRLWQMIGGSLTPTQQQHLDDLVRAPTPNRQSPLDRLRKPPTTPTAVGMLAGLQRLKAIRDLGIAAHPIPMVPAGRLKTLARYAMGARAQAIAALQNPRRLATLRACAMQLEASAHDDVLDIFNQIINALFLSNETQKQKARTRSLSDLDAAAMQLQAVCQMLLDQQYADSEVRPRIFHDHDPAHIAAAIATVRNLVQPKHEPFEAQLDGTYPHLRRFLPTLLETINFDGTLSGKPVLAALQFLRALDAPNPPKLHHAPTEVVGARWRRLVLDSGQVVDRQFYTFAVLERLHQSLDRREVFVSPSERWGDPRAMLLKPDAWESVRTHMCRTLGRLRDPHAELALLDTQLDAAYAETAKNLPENPGVRIEKINDHDRPIITGLDKLDDPLTLKQLRSEIQARMPRADLPEILLEINAMTGFADEFTHLSEGGTRATDLSLSICAVLLAEACNIGLEPLVNQSNPALTRERLAWVQQNYIRPETLTRANARLVAAQATIPIAQAWGGGEVASVDGLRFVVPVRTINAGGSPKHFPRQRGVTWYNGISDQNMGFNAIVIPGALRDAPYLLNVLLEQQTHLQIKEVMTDTAGYSDIVFGLFWLLGYQFSPRLADLKDMRFWRLDPKADYGLLNDVGRHTISTKIITEYWDELLRLAGSLKMGTVQADVVVRWLHGDKRPRTLARAVTEVGRMAKTLYLLAYLDDETYRRRILTQLNKGERRHRLARVIFHGQRGEVRQRYRQGQEDQLGALGLVLNCVVLWNTRYMDAAVAQMQAAGIVIDADDLVRISPFIHRHINVLGRYFFAIPEEVQRGELRPLRDPSKRDLLEDL
ncbi:Tn3 family transposase [Herpetosiphon gulosus]|uniref:Tn3 family transposase Tn3 n=1 Tax=Herpetosiphon gulosus TaxID=1973496 RepID=A0ABP9X7P4_9CHLR